MSFREATEPECAHTRGAVALTITGRGKDLGGFSVRRVLPAAERRMVGPFIFFDHMGPARFAPGQGIQVRPHPHIGLATITYLFEGEIMHRDSLGFSLPIEPGAVNLMTAGRGIVHSERSRPGAPLALHGLQLWLALPAELEECAPAFEHTPAGAVPELVADGARIRVIMGEFRGVASPVRMHSPTLYLDCVLPAGREVRLGQPAREFAIYTVSGVVRIGDIECAEGTMGVACPDASFTLRADRDSRVVVIGGDPVGDRYIWWNFVSSSRDRIERARADWRAGRFAPVPGESEFIPLPE